MAKTIYLKNGSTEILFNENDFQKLVLEHMGYDAEQEVKGLINKGEETYHKVNTDFYSYEQSLSNADSLLSNIMHQLEELRDYVNDSKRIDRNRILENITSIKNEIYNRE